MISATATISIIIIRLKNQDLGIRIFLNKINIEYYIYMHILY